MDATLEKNVRTWIADDPDKDTRAELEALLAKGDEAELKDRFTGTLEFGTAGLRGVIGGGPNRMNRAVVRRATAGLGAYLLDNADLTRTRGVVVGFDGRRLSKELAEETARVFGGLGIPVHLFPHVAPTPLTAFAVLDLKAVAGVMITASHNPPEYNGYKVYWTNGAQIIPPHDKGISAKIAAVLNVSAIQLPELAALEKDGLLRVIDSATEDRYLAAVAKLQVHKSATRDLTIAYTPLHGVGHRLARRALARAGFEKVHTVEAQAEPDGRFPTVKFPNPEEKGAMDLVLALAKEKSAELVLANDPDADRLAVAVPDGKGGWQQLSGDQVGALLAYYLLTEKPGGGERLVVTTIVSSALLGEMAKQLGVQYEETLTGFKWIANRALAVQEERALEFVMGYEEALGYAVGTVVRDKDGVSAAAVFAELAAHCKTKGRTVLGYLEEIYRRFGLFRSTQHTLTLPGAEGLAQIRSTMQRLRAMPPKSIGTRKIAATRDLLASTRVTSGGTETLSLPKSDVLVYELEGGGRITVRPSGTEPKLKSYFELREPIAANETFEAAQQRVDGKLKELISDYVAATGLGK